MMKTYGYRKIDAFTAGASLGNPAACLFLRPGESLTPDEMLAIAKQHKGFVTEVVYCVPKGAAEFGLTYYSSECEVDFCGHGTIACMYGLIAETPALRARKEIVIHTNRKGSLTVYNEIDQRGVVYITAPEPRHIGCTLDTAEIAENLSLPLEAVDASPAHPADVIDGGLRTLIVPVAGHRTTISVFPDEAKLKSFCESHGIDIVLVYTREVADSACIAHTRVFAPRFGYLEDPATGSGNSVFGYYMLKYGLWDGAPAVIEQGGEDRVFNSVALATRGERVLFGGKGTLRIRGEYCIQ